ncbi:MAG: hypothetical protein PQJ58_04200 [Spirochaetales bacterium]|nr:hypothetical protein [Spirochaetales bacterium]
MKEELFRLASLHKPDSTEKIEDQLFHVRETLGNPDPLIRPLDMEDRPGGLVFLHQNIPLIVLPDLHARKDFLYSLLMTPTDSGTVLERLAEGSVQIVCVGDGFHAEKRAYKRWQKAFTEYRGSFRKHRYMDQEMSESLGLMQMVMLLLTQFPSRFFFLKGNHENILNEEGRGNHPFGKFVYEGEMVRFWFEKFMGRDLMEKYAAFEHSLPFMALGRELIITHAEPERYYHPEEIINIHEHDDIKLGLTWTANDRAREGSVEEILSDYSQRFNRAFSYCIGGHRTIRTLYNTRASGRYIQIHNPDRQIVLFSDQIEKFDPQTNIADLQQTGRLPI